MGNDHRKIWKEALERLLSLQQPLNLAVEERYGQAPMIQLEHPFVQTFVVSDPAVATLSVIFDTERGWECTPLLYRNIRDGGLWVSGEASKEFKEVLERFVLPGYFGCDEEALRSLDEDNPYIDFERWTYHRPRALNCHACAYSLSCLSLGKAINVPGAAG